MAPVHADKTQHPPKTYRQANLPFSFASATTNEILYNHPLPLPLPLPLPPKLEETMPSLQTALPPELANNVIRVKYHFLFASFKSMLTVIIQIPNFHGFNRSFTVNVFEELNILVIR